MQFALLGNHPDGIDMAAALVASGRHQLVAYSGIASPDVLRPWAMAARSVGDVEEILADPAMEAVIVAESLTTRPALVRRALQSERHVLCVHPADQSPDIAYEAAMIRADTGKVLLPLLPEAEHAGVVRLAELARDRAGPVGECRLVDLERFSAGEVLIGGRAERKPACPGWDVLRAVGGDIVELAAYAAAEEISATEPVLLNGRFENGLLWRASFLPHQATERYRLAVSGTRGRAELLFPIGRHGPAYLSWRDEAGELHEEAWTAHDPWPALVHAFETAVAGTPHDHPSWQDEIRALELDDAVRRSVERRRASALEYPEATEEAGFKGTMTLVGCGLLWALLMLVIVANWFPALFWGIIPLVVVFLGLQVLRWVVPARRP